MSATTPARVSSDGASVLERVVVHNDLTKLQPAERLAYYSKLCASLGLNPLTRPFRYLYLDGKLTLYITRDGTDQLRAKHKVSITSCDAKFEEGLYIVTARALLPDGRTDEDLGAVALEGLKGHVRANAIMKAITKAKRRVTLSAVGLGLLDESEVEDIPSALHVDVDPETGEIRPPETSAPMPGSAEEMARPAYVNEDDERQAWLSRITAAQTQRGMKGKQRADLWIKHCGDGDPRTVDIAALQALYDDVTKQGVLP